MKPSSRKSHRVKQAQAQLKKELQARGFDPSQLDCRESRDHLRVMVVLHPGDTPSARFIVGEEIQEDRARIPGQLQEELLGGKASIPTFYVSQTDGELRLWKLTQRRLVRVTKNEIPTQAQLEQVHDDKDVKNPTPWECLNSLEWNHWLGFIGIGMTILGAGFGFGRTTCHSANSPPSAEQASAIEAVRDSLERAREEADRLRESRSLPARDST